jgi:nucleotidyltransferase substrate binding protein (TIGR01987 family)
MALNLDSLRKSIDSLSRSIAAAEKNMHLFDVDTQDTMRAGVIQNFEVAYEQCWKMLQRWIKVNRTPEDAVNPRTRKDLFRMVARYGLIADPLPWFTYGEARNLTSHIYDAEIALSVYATAISFYADAEYVLNQLEQLND